MFAPRDGGQGREGCRGFVDAFVEEEGSEDEDSEADDLDKQANDDDFLAKVGLGFITAIRGASEDSAAYTNDGLVLGA